VRAVHVCVTSNLNVEVLELRPRFDHYEIDYLHGNWLVSGVPEMFYPMMTKFAKDLGFGFVLWYDPETFPLRNDG
jgi:hypothetical protein